MSVTEAAALVFPLLFGGAAIRYAVFWIWRRLSEPFFAYTREFEEQEEERGQAMRQYQCYRRELHDRIEKAQMDYDEVLKDLYFAAPLGEDD